MVSISTWTIAIAFEETMILIGQYDSPFVRRVAIALRLYDLFVRALAVVRFRRCRAAR
jgi:hypothetical protein